MAGQRRAPVLVLTGVPELDKKLSVLQQTAGNRVARSSLGAGLRVGKKAIQSKAPGTVKKTIGVRMGKARNGKFEAKVGINVGKDGKKKFKAPHAHLVALGTQVRTRKVIGGKFSYLTNPTADQLSTGRMPANPFVKESFASARGEMSAAMKAAFDRSLAREIAKAKLNKG